MIAILIVLRSSNAFQRILALLLKGIGLTYRFLRRVM